MLKFNRSEAIDILTLFEELLSFYITDQFQFFTDSNEERKKLNFINKTIL